MTINNTQARIINSTILTSGLKYLVLICNQCVRDDHQSNRLCMIITNPIIRTNINVKTSMIYVLRFFLVRFQSIFLIGLSTFLDNILLTCFPTISKTLSLISLLSTITKFLLPKNLWKCTYIFLYFIPRIYCNFFWYCSRSISISFK